MSLVRSRWAAVGAAVAIALGAGGIGLVNATSPSGAITFVPITPCRVLDTRPAFKVGPKTTPLGPGEVHTVSAHGDNGRCTDIPATATGLSLNITALDASLPTFLTVWATGAPQPDSSSLNPTPGQPPTPNAVTTGLSTNGQFDIFNLQGTVDVIGDINGYYTDHDHDDRYYTKPQVDAEIADNPGPQGPEGPPGEQGEQGPPGEQGPAGEILATGAVLSIGGSINKVVIDTAGTSGPGVTGEGPLSLDEPRRVLANATAFVLDFSGVGDGATNEFSCHLQARDGEGEVTDFVGNPLPYYFPDGFSANYAITGHVDLPPGVWNIELYCDGTTGAPYVEKGALTAFAAAPSVEPG